jgi:hypothetical protein
LGAERDAVFTLGATQLRTRVKWCSSQDAGIVITKVATNRLSIEPV